MVERCLEPECPGKLDAELLRPGPADDCVLKPKHSTFFSTTLDTLLRYLGTEMVVIGSFVADICVLFTANDAYMRDLRNVIASDGVASNNPADRDAALALVRRVLIGATPRSGKVDFTALASL